MPDCQNGCYRWYLLAERGDIELLIFRTRRLSPLSVIHAYARKAPQVDRQFLAC